jgi:hypothetical protein
MISLGAAHSGGRKWEVINLCKTEHFSFLFHFICLISLRKYFLCFLLFFSRGEREFNQLHKLSMNIIGFESSDILAVINGEDV